MDRCHTLGSPEVSNLLCGLVPGGPGCPFPLLSVAGDGEIHWPTRAMRWTRITLLGILGEVPTASRQRRAPPHAAGALC